VSPTLEASLRSWPFAPGLLASLLFAAGIYVRGWLGLKHRSGGQLAAFLGGLSAVYLALASPIEPLASLLLQVHMLQHLLLTMVAAPLLWLGAPLLPSLRGLPRPVLVGWVAPLLGSRTLQRLFRQLAHPLVALPIFVGVTWLWHLPPLYDQALRFPAWHYAQHVCFLGAALLFWYPIVRPYPSRPRWSPWLLLPYLLLADLSNTLLSAVLTFSGRVLYPYYEQAPRLAGSSVLDDQSAAGVLMWVPGSIVFLVPLFVIGVQLLFGAFDHPRHLPRVVTPRRVVAQSQLSLPIIGQPGLMRRPVAFDLLRVPLLGRFLRWRHARLSVQVPLLVLAGLIVYDGFRGPSIAAMNLAGTLPWIHWRGLVVLGLLAAGNVSCMACPFVVPRTLARRWLPQGRTWPRWLRSKWLAVALLALFLWAYEALSLWDSPWWTAWIIVAYFAAAFAIDGFFRGASFCKYVCPIGQFNFVQSLVSPLDVKVRDPQICASCRTKECIRGGDDVRGCDMMLILPEKANSLDCTLCLDCIHACPHDNVGILAGPPGEALRHNRLGRYSQRLDLSALIVVLAFGAIVNAAGMVAPVLDRRDALAARLHQTSPFVVVSGYYVIGLIVLPALLVGISATLSRWAGQGEVSAMEVATRFVPALVPIGFAMWLAHYSLHFLGSFDAVIPTLARFAGDVGSPLLGRPEWIRACCRPVANWLPRLEILFLDLGLLLSLYTAYRISCAHTKQTLQTLKALAPWALLIVLLFATGVWIVLQPMQMRGTLPAPG
jgi:cytochrome c oxidase assembly factor CtaG/ferredoxin